MNAVRIIILAVAAVAAIAVAVLVRTMTARPAPAPAQVAAPAAPAPRPMTRVLTARMDLPVGTRLSAENLAWQDWPAENLNPTFITDGSAPVARPTGAAQGAAHRVQQMAGDALSGNQAMQAVEGAIVRTAIVRGQPILPNSIVRGGEGGYMSVVLGPGMRAMSVPVNVDASAGGFVLPGDRVDVLISHAARNADQGFVAELVMRNVRVLAIDQQTSPEADARAIVGGVATLEIPEGDMEVMARARAQGNVILALRSYADLGGASGRAGSRSSDEAGPQNSVRIFRAGQPSQVQVSP
jgi:pilus assembly protein CpaB